MKGKVKQKAKKDKQELTASELDYIRHLEGMNQSESRENEAEYAHAIGKTVSFGDTIQLRHYKSGKYLTVSQAAAKLSNACIRVKLLEDGTEGSWFKVMPRFKMRSEGESVYIGDQLILASRKFDMYLHVSSSGDALDLDCSSTWGAWRTIPYAPFVRPADAVGYLRAGDIVRFYHREAEGVITCEFVLSDTQPPSGRRTRRAEDTEDGDSSSDTDELYFSDSDLDGEIAEHLDSVLEEQEAADDDLLLDDDTDTKANANTNANANANTNANAKEAAPERERASPSASPTIHSTSPTSGVGLGVPRLMSRASSHEVRRSARPGVSWGAERFLNASRAPPAYAIESHGRARVFLEANKAENAANSNSLFVVERLDRMRGGTTSISDVLTFRHLATGKFLAVDLAHGMGSSTASPAAHRLSQTVRSLTRSLPQISSFSTTHTLSLKLVSGPPTPCCYFVLLPAERSELGATDTTIRQENYFRIKHVESGCYLHTNNLEARNSSPSTESSTSLPASVVQPPPPSSSTPPTITTTSSSATSVPVPSSASGTTSTSLAAAALAVSNATASSSIDTVRLDLTAEPLIHDADVFVFVSAKTDEILRLGRVRTKIAFLANYAYREIPDHRARYKQQELAALSAGTILTFSPTKCKVFSDKTLGKVASILRSLVNQCVSPVMQDLYREQSVCPPRPPPRRCRVFSLINPFNSLSLALAHQVCAIILGIIGGLFDETGIVLRALPENLHQSPYAEIQIVCQRSFELLSKMAANCSKTQQILGRFLDTLKAHVGLHQHAAETLLHVYTNNMALLTSIDDKQLDFWLELIRKKRCVRRYIEILMSWTHLHGKPLSRNQKAIARELLASQTGASQHFFRPEMFDGELCVRAQPGRLIPLERVATEGTPKEVEYMTACIQLCSKLTNGGNSFTAMMLGPALDATVVLRTVECDTLPPPLRAALVDLLRNVYIALNHPSPVSYLVHTRLWDNLDLDLTSRSSDSLHSSSDGSDTESDTESDLLASGEYQLSRSPDSSSIANEKPKPLPASAPHSSGTGTNSATTTPINIAGTPTPPSATHSSSPASEPPLQLPASLDRFHSNSTTNTTHLLSRHRASSAASTLVPFRHALQPPRSQLAVSSAQSRGRDMMRDRAPAPVSPPSAGQPESRHRSSTETSTPVGSNPVGDDRRAARSRSRSRSLSRREQLHYSKQDVLAMKSFVLNFLVHIKQHQSKLTLSVLELCKQLVLCGLLSIEESVSLVDTLTHLLSFGNDSLAATSRAKAEGAKAAKAGKAEKATANLTEMDPELLEDLTATKVCVIETLNIMADMRLNRRVTRVLQVIQAHIPIDAELAAYPLSAASTAELARGTSTASLQGRGASTTATTTSTSTPAVTDPVLERLTEHFRTNQSMLLEELNQAAFSFAADSENGLLEMLKQLTTSPQPELALSAATLLVRCHCSIEDVLQTIGEIQVLVDDAMVRVYRRVHRLARSLQHLLDSPSCGSTRNIAAQLALTSAMSSQLQRVQNDPVMLREHQRIARDQRLPEIALRVLSMLRLEGGSICPANASASHSRVRLALAALDVLRLCCTRNFTMQRRLFNEIQVFVELLAEHLVGSAAGAVMLEIFRDNHAACTSVTDATMRAIVFNMASHKYCVLLELLQELMQPRGKSIRGNQLRITKLIFEVPDAVTLYNTPESEQHFRSLIQSEVWLEPGNELEYHAQQVQLLCLCCRQKIYDAEVKIQSKLSIDYIMSQILNVESLPVLRGAYLRLLYDVRT